MRLLRLVSVFLSVWLVAGCGDDGAGEIEALRAELSDLRTQLAEPTPTPMAPSAATTTEAPASTPEPEPTPSAMPEPTPTASTVPTSTPTPHVAQAPAPTATATTAGPTPTPTLASRYSAEQVQQIAFGHFVNDCFQAGVVGHIVGAGAFQATYQGNGLWRVTGPIVLSPSGGGRAFSATFDETNSAWVGVDDASGCH